MRHKYITGKLNGYKLYNTVTLPEEFVTACSQNFKFTCRQYSQIITEEFNAEGIEKG